MTSDPELVSRANLAAIIMAELQRQPGCEGVRSVEVQAIGVHTDKDPAPGKWAVGVINWGSSKPEDVEAALRAIVVQLQTKYLLAL